MRSPRVPLAWKNLTHDLRRLATALCGIGFAVVLMFMQTGFKNALFDSTVQVVKDLDADIVLLSRLRYNLPARQLFSRTRIYQARGCQGVEEVYPLYIEVFRAVWRQPGGKGSPIRVLACELTDPVFLIPAVAEFRAALQTPGTALLDRHSKRKLYGIPDSEEEVLRQRGVELCGRAIRIVGTFSMATDFANDGNLIMSAANFARYFPQRAPGDDPLSLVDLGIVQVRPGAEVEAVQQRLRALLPRDMMVYTKQELVDREIGFWSSSTPIGFVFLVGTVIGFVVGVIICYQIIHGDIADHMAEYATLKAMGYARPYFVRLVLEEALYLSVLSFLPGWLVSLALYHALAAWTGLLMMLTLPRAALVFGLTIGMCIISGGLAMRKVLAADPADLY
jgi:putative ABC transport system permease protein